MTEIIKFFTTDLTSLLFLPEKEDTTSGFSAIPPASTEEAWQRDMHHLSQDAARAIEKVRQHEPQAI